MYNKYSTTTTSTKVQDKNARCMCMHVRVCVRAHNTISERVPRDVTSPNPHFIPFNPRPRTYVTYV